ASSTKRCRAEFEQGEQFEELRGKIDSLSTRLAQVQNLGKKLTDESASALVAATAAKDAAAEAKDVAASAKDASVRAVEGFEKLCGITAKIDADVKTLDTDWSAGKKILESWSTVMDSSMQQMNGKIEQIVAHIAKPTSGNSFYITRNIVLDESIAGIVGGLLADCTKYLSILATLDPTRFNFRNYYHEQVPEARVVLDRFPTTVENIRFLQVSGRNDSIVCFFEHATNQIKKSSLACANTGAAFLHLRPSQGGGEGETGHLGWRPRVGSDRRGKWGPESLASLRHILRH
ncbi:hypothetical protein BDK51DRAFT_31970, partial [Blyttiomyces helicus]